ncbi:MAG: glycosyltransferase family 2 protein, partial [Haloglomus sp.]
NTDADADANTDADADANTNADEDEADATDAFGPGPGLGVRSSADSGPDSDSYRPDWWWDEDAGSLREAFPTPARDSFPVSVPESVSEGWLPSVRWDTDHALAGERLLTSLFIGLFTAGVLAMLGYFVSIPFRTALVSIVYYGLWVFVGLYGVATAIWVYEAYLAWQYDPPPIAYGPEDVQVRILTIAAAAVVQETVDALPEELTDRHVVAEAPIDVDGAEVHVVPDEFECAASDKGRALEWARRNVACDREFVLFLDEDTIVTEFEGLPVADIVQFREWPMFTGSYLTYWAEVLRMGYQTEQLGFAELDVPLYAWGGGIAVREEVEDLVTWNYDTLIEDTVFTWLASREGAEFEVVETKFRNQAPPSLVAMFKQRRRWLTGTLRDERYLPCWFRWLTTVRNVAWVFSPVTVVLVAFSGLVPLTIPGARAFMIVAWAMFAFSLYWVVRGWRYYEGPSLRSLPVFLLYPFVVAIHSLGAAWGFVSPPESFETTQKTDEHGEAAEHGATAHIQAHGKRPDVDSTPDRATDAGRSDRD